MVDSNNISIMWKIMLAMEEAQLEVGISNCLDEMRESYEVSSASLWVLDESTNHIYAIVSSGKVDVSGYRIKLGDGFVGTCIKNNEPIILNDTDNNEFFARGKDRITRIQAENVLCVPMRLKKKVVGCVMLNDRTNGEGFKEEETKFLMNIGAIIAMVMDERGYEYVSDKDRKVILSIKDIKKDFPSGMDTLHVLKGINLDIYENEFLVFLGESGCGKTTLLNIIGGMDAMTEGTLSIDGKDFTHPSEKELTMYRRNMIGFIFQSYNLMPNLTAIQNVQFVAELCKNPMKAEDAIEMVGLTDRANNYPSMMSGGQQQRVSIARAVVKNPRLILADEPTAALDFETGQEVLTLIEDLVKKKVATVIMVTHNVEIAKMANRVVRLKDGKIASVRKNAWPLSAKELSW